ncbi:hypothetical protein OHA25_60430 (plasmid) [Nonomuraea sp. NBC_00507]|uniref:hypothetical protein n=1 Tax=Nonomuraea sp. NBC_00507 TaxID=2976002 RepID=UPI002E198FE0
MPPNQTHQLDPVHALRAIASSLTAVADRIGSSGGALTTQLPADEAVGGAEHLIDAIDVLRTRCPATAAIYGAIRELATTARAYLTIAQTTSDIDTSPMWRHLASATADYLSTLPVDDLQTLAHQNGFVHPEFVGWTAGRKRHPLVHWLDPAYPADHPSKIAIQARALERRGVVATST